MGCCVIPLCCVGSDVCFTLRSLAGGVDGSCGTDMLNMDANLFSVAACFSPRRGMGLDGSALWRASVRSAAACVTESSGGRLGDFFCNGKIYVVLETRYNYVLGMYDVRHR